MVGKNLIKKCIKLKITLNHIQTFASLGTHISTNFLLVSNFHLETEYARVVCSNVPRRLSEIVNFNYPESTR